MPTFVATFLFIICISLCMPHCMSHLIYGVDLLLNQWEIRSIAITIGISHMIGKHKQP